MRVLWSLPKAAPALLRHLRRLCGSCGSGSGPRAAGNHRAGRGLGHRRHLRAICCFSGSVSPWWLTPGTRRIGSAPLPGWAADSWASPLQRPSIAPTPPRSSRSFSPPCAGNGRKIASCSSAYCPRIRIEMTEREEARASTRFCASSRESREELRRVLDPPRTDRTASRSSTTAREAFRAAAPCKCS